MANPRQLKLLLEGLRAPREEALEVAQRNAVEEFGAPRNNTPLERAEMMGFDITKPYYHGSLRGGREGATSRRSNPSGHAGRGFYTTPHPEDASINYANPLGPDQKFNFEEWMYDKGVSPRLLGAFANDELSPARLEKIMRASGLGDTLGTVYPLLLRRNTGANLTDRTLAGRMEGKGMRGRWEKASDTLEQSGVDMPDELYDLLGTRANYNDVAKALGARYSGSQGTDPVTGLPYGPFGLTTAVLKDLGAETFTHRTHWSNPKLNIAGHHTIVLEPSAARSPFAAFDPKKRKSSDLLANVFPLTTGTTTTALLANRLREEEQ